MASLTMSSRLVKKIREEMSIVYSIRASSVPAQIYEDAGRFIFIDGLVVLREEAAPRRDVRELSFQL